MRPELHTFGADVIGGGGSCGHQVGSGRLRQVGHHLMGVEQLQVGASAQHVLNLDDCLRHVRRTGDVGQQPFWGERVGGRIEQLLLQGGQ